MLKGNEKYFMTDYRFLYSHKYNRCRKLTNIDSKTEGSAP